MKSQPRLLHLVLILICAAISWSIGITMNLIQFDLGSLMNLYSPPILCAISLALFIAISYLTADRKIRLYSLSIFCLANLGLGFMFLLADYFQLAH